MQRDEKAANAGPQPGNFFQTVNGTLKTRRRHACSPAELPFFVKNFAAVKKFLLALAATAAFSTPSDAQPVAAADTIFPYNVMLVSPDSSRTTASRDLFKPGQVTVLVFWLTTCHPCQVELDAYTANYADWQKQADFRLIAISTDFPFRFRQVGARLREKQYPFEVWWDRFRGFSRVLPGELNGLPQVFIFDKTGRLAWRHKGFWPGDEREMFAKVLELSAP